MSILFKLSVAAAATLATYFPFATAAGRRLEVINQQATKKEDSFNEYAERPMSVIALNRFSFEGNVLECLGDNVDHWVVLFCPPWYRLCKKVLPVFRNTSQLWQDKLNNGVMRSLVRFGEVDCATDKELCNEQLIDEYPTVVHYSGGARTSRWTASKPADFQGLNRWVAGEIKVLANGGVASRGFAMKRRRQPTLETGTVSQDAIQFSPIALTLLVVFITGNVLTVLVGAGYAADMASWCPRSSDDTSGKSGTLHGEAACKVASCLPAEWVQGKGTLDL